MESQGKHIIKIRKTILRELKKDDQREARKNEPKRLNVCVCVCALTNPSTVVQAFGGMDGWKCDK